MTSEWRTLADAAAILGVSARTLRRKIKAGELETDVQDGRRVVLIATPPVRPDVMGPDTADNVTDRPLAIASAIFERYDRQQRASRWNGRVAWAIVFGLLVAVGWGVHLTATLQGHAETAKARLCDVQAALDKTRQEADQARAQVAAAGRRAVEALDALLTAKGDLAESQVLLERERAARAILEARMAQAATTQPVVAVAE